MYYSYSETPETYDLGAVSVPISNDQYPQSYDAIYPTNYENIGNAASVENVENLDYNYYNPENYTQTPITYEQYDQYDQYDQNVPPESDPLVQNYSPKTSYPENYIAETKPPENYIGETIQPENYIPPPNLEQPPQNTEKLGVPDIPQPIFSINQNNSINNVNSISSLKVSQKPPSITNSQSLIPETTKSVYLPKAQTPSIHSKLKSVRPENSQISEKEKIRSEIDEAKLKNFADDYDIYSHFQLKIYEEPNIFKFERVRKIAKPLLAHMELPDNYDYKSPSLSPNGLYLSCIATSISDDIVYIWDMSNLYYYKYKFESLKVDSATFTPDSEKIIIIYKDRSPIMYSLIDGKLSLEFQPNGEEINRGGYNYAFTVMGNHFGYTSDKSFTLWSLRTGNIKMQILDNSPIKFIAHDFLVCISEDLICKILKIATGEILVNFKLNGIENLNEILDVKCSDDMESLIYVIKEGIIRYVFKDKEFKGIQKFTSGVEKAIISDDSKLVVKTNMRNISIYDIEKQETIATILKEKFKEIRIDFPNKKLMVVDNISINIQDYKNEDAPEKYVWLNKNPTNFVDTKFSNDFSVLLARVDRNNAVAYSCETGKIIKKWQNIDDNWLDFAITSIEGSKIATKSNFFLIKVWDYKYQRDKEAFYGFDSHSINFDGKGKYLACGAEKGPEIARIWDIKKGVFGSFPYVGENMNFHTVVHLTYPMPNKLICCAIGQQPLIFDSNTKELLYKCECKYKLEEIYDIQSDQKCDIFLVKGRDTQKRNIGLLYRISDGVLLEVFENYTVMELSSKFGIVVTKCSNLNKGQLTSIDYNNLSNPIINTFEIQNNRSSLLNDQKTLVSLSGQNFNEIDYLLSNIENGIYLGKINFMKKTDRNSQEYLTVNTCNNELEFRYYELLTPEETMAYKKKKLFW